MTNENYKRASEIQDEIKVLKEHLSDLDNASDPCLPEYGICCRFNENFPAVNLRPDHVPLSFLANYVKNVKNRIAELQDEFENL
jgi:hypothetical protein